MNMVNGRPAIKGDSAGELFQQHLIGSPDDVRQSVNLPADVGLAIFRCLDKEPPRRFESVSELRSALIDGAAEAAPPSAKTRILVAWTMAVAVTIAVFAITLQTGEPAKPAAPVTPASKTPPPLLPLSPKTAG